MATQVFTATARLRIAGDALLFWLHDDPCVGERRWQILPLGHQELLAFEGDHRLGLLRCVCLPSLQAAYQGEHSRLKLSTEDGASPQAAQERLIHRRIETVEAEMGPWVQRFDVLYHLCGDARRSVHRDIEAHHIGGR